MSKLQAHVIKIFRSFFLIACVVGSFFVHAQISEQLTQELTAWVRANVQSKIEIKPELIKELEEHIEDNVFFRTPLRLDGPRKQLMGFTAPIHRNFQSGFPLVAQRSDAEIHSRIDYSALIREDQETFNEIFRQHPIPDTALRRNIVKLLYRRMCEDHAELNRELSAGRLTARPAPALSLSKLPEGAQPQQVRKPRPREIIHAPTRITPRRPDIRRVYGGRQGARDHATQTDPFDPRGLKTFRDAATSPDASPRPLSEPLGLRARTPYSSPLRKDDARRFALIAKSAQPRYQPPARTSPQAPQETRSPLVHWLGVFPPPRKTPARKPSPKEPAAPEPSPVPDTPDVPELPVVVAQKKDRKPYWQGLITSLENRIDAIDERETSRREMLLSLLKEHHQSYERTFGSDAFLDASKSKVTEHERNLARAKLPKETPVTLGTVAAERIALKRTPQAKRSASHVIPQARREPRVRDVLKDFRKKHETPEQPARRPRQMRLGHTLADYRAAHARH